MNDGPDIIAEVRAARDAYARRFNYDLEAIVRDLRERGEAEGRPGVVLHPRRIGVVPDRPPAIEQPA